MKQFHERTTAEMKKNLEDASKERKRTEAEKLQLDEKIKTQKRKGDLKLMRDIEEKDQEIDLWKRRFEVNSFDKLTCNVLSIKSNVNHCCI